MIKKLLGDSLMHYYHYLICIYLKQTLGLNCRQVNMDYLLSRSKWFFIISPFHFENLLPFILYC
jgi:hypothetical protein